MKSASSLAAGLLTAALVVNGNFETNLMGQDGPGEIFTVPFAFTADGHEIQPGTYEIRRDANQFFMSIQNVKTRETQLFSVRPEERSAIPAKGLLVFQACGARKELNEFHVRGTNIFSATIKSRRNNTLEAESCSHPQSVTVAAR